MSGWPCNYLKVALMLVGENGVVFRTILVLMKGLWDFR